MVGLNHPARYALVEIENVHDEGLHFEPIHRVLFGVKDDLKQSLKQHFGANLHMVACASPEEMIEKVEHHIGKEHAIGFVSPEGAELLLIGHPESNLPVGSLQPFLDGWLKQGGAAKIDYVHGADATVQLSLQPGNCGFYLPSMPKGDLFKTVIMDGALPRKTFSMGEAVEKRFYMEARRIA